jgi:DNA invertase Pin-like site-specific DNA recombinase
MALKSTIYARFSNQEQARGNSKERQLRLCREMAQRHGWEHDLVDEIIDEGKSAFVGTNRAEGGGLWSFEQKAAAGHYQGGHVLVVEHLDRISRQGYDAILPFLQTLTDKGVTVATVDGDRIYHAFERVPLGPVVEAVVKSELAREESEKKSKRLRAAQAKKVEKAQEYASQGLYIATTRTVPAWIQVDPQTYEMTLNEQRVDLLREIFQLTIDGYGTPAIARRLNERGEPVWNYRGIRSNNGWTVGYLTKLVTNRAVMGEARPMNRPRHGKPSSKEVVILNRYPQAIDPVMFSRALAARQSRKNTSGAWQISHGNLFSGIAKCAVCGGRMKQEVTARSGTTRSKGRGQKVYTSHKTFSYLKCYNAINHVFDEKRGLIKCQNKSFIRYENLENAVLGIALHDAVTDAGAADSNKFTQLQVAISEANRHVEDKQRRIDYLVDSFGRTGSPSVERAMLVLEAEAEEDRKSIKRLEQGLDLERGTISPEEHMKRVADLRASLNSEDDEERAAARVGLKQTLRGIITRMECGPTKETRIILGDNAIGLVFDGDGELISNRILQSEIIGPDGERNWHPDRALEDW